MKIEGQGIRHFSHNHHLRFLQWSVNEYVLHRIFRCGVCNQWLVDSLYYRCSKSGCSYVLHERCAELPQQMNHSLHPLHQLTLRKGSSSRNHMMSCCYYCDKTFQDEDENSYPYACNQCSNFYMHRECAIIPLPTISTTTQQVDQDDHGVIQYVCHGHPMPLVEQDHYPKRGADKANECFACQSQWSAPAYSCTSESCENFLHKSCAELPREIQHTCHSRHPLLLQVSKPRSCKSCCKPNCRLIFGCHEDGCNINLCTECVFLTAVKYPSHGHFLLLAEKASCNIQCNACQKSYGSCVDFVPNEIKRTLPFLFRCIDCDFGLHFLCGPLPSSIKNKCHIHPLTLYDHIVIQDDSDKYYCDVCEEEMNQRFRTYSCKDCKYMAHIHCFIPQIMRMIKKNSKDHVKMWALGDNRWDFSRLRVQDNLAAGGGLDHGHHVIKESTLKEMMDSLSQHERDLLVGQPFEPEFSFQILRRSKERTIERNSRLDRKGSLEDIDRLKIFFQFKPEDFSSFMEELHYLSYVEGGLMKLLGDEKLISREKVVNVEGYMVPSSLAPILTTLLRHRYGNRFSTSNLTPGAKSIAATSLCIIIDRMCKTKVEDINKSHLNHWYFYLKAIGKITDLEITESLLKSFKRLVRSFLGLEAIRCQKEGLKDLHHGIADLRAKLKRYEGLREKYVGYDESMASDLMQEFMKTGSEHQWESAGDVVLSDIL